jgi:hypothetical protein
MQFWTRLARIRSRTVTQWPSMVVGTFHYFVAELEPSPSLNIEPPATQPYHYGDISKPSLTFPKTSQALTE